MHLGIPYSKVETYGINISITILKLTWDFKIQEKFITYTTDGGYNFKMCQDSLAGKFTNTKIYCTQQTTFQQYFFVHALQGARKAVVLNCKSEDDEGKLLCAL